MAAQLPGWHTNRKIIVIESDDWGCWRTRDKKSLDALSGSFPHILDDPYNRLDTLETEEDLEALFEVLRSVRDKNGNPAVITANTIVANPDFTKIKEANFNEYHYARFTDGLSADPIRNGLLTLINQGIGEGLYRPQLHGREHLNINQWLHALRVGHKELRKAFDVEMFGVQLKEKINMRSNVMAALDFDNIEELTEQSKIVEDAQSIFEDIFGFSSTTFIAPSYVWHPDLERSFLNSGIRSLQGLPYQYIPNPGGTWYKKQFRYTGKTTKSGINHLARNAFFEPALTPNVDVVSDCMRRIELAFHLKKPAIIGSHRVSFIGSLDEKNRFSSLEKLRCLLKSVTTKWSGVEFLSSDQLII